jgi:hypothetical protein
LELLVVIVIITLITGPLALFFTRGLMSYNQLDMQTNSATELGILSGKITTVIRNATGVDTAQDNTFIFYSYNKPTDTAVSKYRYFVSGNTLSVGIIAAQGTAPNYTYPSASEVVKVMRTDLAMNSQPMFTYYDMGGSQLTGTFDVDAVRQVGLFLSVNPNTVQLAKAVSVTNRVTIRNLKDNL